MFREKGGKGKQWADHSAGTGEGGPARVGHKTNLRKQLQADSDSGDVMYVTALGF
jgi:hypothetical protein